MDEKMKNLFGVIKNILPFDLDDVTDVEENYSAVFVTAAGHTYCISVSEIEDDDLNEGGN